MHMNEEREEAEDDTKKHIFVPSEVNGNFTIVFKDRRNHQTLSKNTLSCLSGFPQICFSLPCSRSWLKYRDMVKTINSIEK